MVWLFVLLTVVTYCLVTKYVLDNLHKPAKATSKKSNELAQADITNLTPVETVR